MAWIWSDELAEAAESAGLAHREIASWRRRPVAFALPPDERPETLARQMLGLAPARQDDECTERPDAVPVTTCSCGRSAMLAPHAADG